jgi:hypothetical protein
VVAITSDVQGPAKVEFQDVFDADSRILDDTFPAHPNAVRMLGLLLADMENSGVAGLSPSNTGLSPSALHVQNNGAPTQPGLAPGPTRTLVCPGNGYGWGAAGACAIVECSVINAALSLGGGIVNNTCTSSKGESAQVPECAKALQDAKDLKYEACEATAPLPNGAYTPPPPSSCDYNVDYGRFDQNGCRTPGTYWSDGNKGWACYHCYWGT